MSTPSAVSATPHSPGVGIAWMLLTMLLFVSMDTLAKYLAQSYPVLQIVWARFFFHGIWLALYLHRQLPRYLHSQRIWLQLGRGACLVATTMLFFSALSLLPLANASAIMLVGPLIVTALSMPLLGEQVGPRRWAGVIIGFGGALIIIRPGSDVMQWASLLPLAAACIYGLYQISTRVLSRFDPPLTTLLYTVSVGLPVCTLLLPWIWVWPDGQGWLLMAGVGLLGGLSHFTLIKAFSVAPAVVITPFSYSNMLWAISLGYLVFGEWPDHWTLIGAGIIAASGLYIFYREQQLKQQ